MEGVAAECDPFQEEGKAFSEAPPGCLAAHFSLARRKVCEPLAYSFLGTFYGLARAWGRGILCCTVRAWELDGQGFTSHETLRKSPSWSFSFLMSKIRAIIQPSGLL